jgi:hypothetical protein
MAKDTMSTSMSKEESNADKTTPLAVSGALGRVSRFESLVSETFMERMGLGSALEVINATIADAPEPLTLSHPLECISLDTPIVAGEEPTHDLVISRNFSNLKDSDNFPSPLVIKDELRRLVTLSRRYVMVMYPSSAPYTILSLFSNLRSGFSLEGFLPHRFPETPHDKWETSKGDFYIFANTHDGTALPEPFGITGGPSLLSPIGTGEEVEDDSEKIVKNLQLFTSQGLLSDALPFIYRLIALRPTDIRIRINLALNLALLGETLEGERVLKGVLCESPKNYQARMALCKIFLSVSDYENLRAFLPELLFLRNADPKVTEMWAEIRDGLKSLETQPLEAQLH